MLGLGSLTNISCAVYTRDSSKPCWGHTVPELLPYHQSGRGETAVGYSRPDPSQASDFPDEEMRLREEKGLAQDYAVWGSQVLEPMSLTPVMVWGNKRMLQPQSLLTEFPNFLRH